MIKGLNITDECGKLNHLQIGDIAIAKGFKKELVVERDPQHVVTLSRGKLGIMEKLYVEDRGRVYLATAAMSLNDEDSRFNEYILRRAGL